MAMDLGIGIKVDPVDSAAKADAVTAALHKTEDQGIAAGKAMLGLAGNFRSLAQAIQQHQAALDRTHVAHRHLSSSLPAAAAGFAKVAEAMRKEHEMLERIHGPARRYAEDLQALDSLLARNAINTQQYADQVRRLNREIDGAPKVANSNIAAARTGPNLGALRGAAAAVGVTVGASQLGQMANEFQTLQNRLRYLAGGDMEKVNSLFGQLQEVAGRTRADLSATTEAFVRMSLATKQMGLSSDETLRLTESLNKAIALSGATGAEAAAGMIQLSQGLASGALRGDELRSVMEQLPAVADVIASGLGVTRGELRKMGEDGKITADVIVNAFKKAGDTLDKDFGNTVPTISQSFTMFKNEMIVTIGELDKALGVSSAFGAVLGGLTEVVKVLVVPLQLVGGALDAIGMTGPIAASALAGMMIGGPLAAVTAAAVAALAEYTTVFDDIGGSLVGAIEDFEKWNQLQNDAERTWLRTPEAINAARVALVEFNLSMTMGAAAAQAFRDAIEGKGKTDPWAHAADGVTTLDRAIQVAKLSWADLTAAQNDNGKAAAKQREEYERLARALLGTESASQRAIREAAQSRAEFAADVERAVQAEIDAEKRAAEGAKMAAEWKLKAQEEVNKAYEDAVKERREAEEKAAEASRRAAEETAQAWGSGLGDIASSFIDAARAGEQSFAAMTQNMLRDIAILTLKMAALEAIKSGVSSGGISSGTGSFLTGLLGGFAGGGSFRVPYDSDRWVLPRAANGANWTVGGTGGTDSKIAMFRVTPGESVHVRTPQQQAASSSGGADTAAILAALERLSAPTFVVEDREAIYENMPGSYAAQRATAQMDRKRGRR